MAELLYPSGEAPESYPRIKVSRQKSIFDELIKMDLPRDVAETADHIYHQVDGDKSKSRKKKHIHFYCVYNAYKLMGQPQIPVNVANAVKLDQSEIAKALSLFRPLPFVDVSPSDLIPRYCNLVGIMKETSDAIVDFSKQFVGVSNEIDDKSPQAVAVAIICLYMAINGGNINMDELSKHTNLSKVSIMLIDKKLRGIYNAS